MKNRSGIEKKIIKEEETGREIWQMTDYPAHNIHPYYDICPWSPNQEKIIFSAAYEEDLFDVDERLDSRKGHLLMIDACSGEIDWLKDNLWFNTHVGCMPIWAPDSKKVFYSTAEKDDDNFSKTTTEVFDVFRRKVAGVFEGFSARMVNPVDTSKVLCTSDDGVILFDTSTLNKKLIIPIYKVLEQMPEYYNNIAHSPGVYNLKWSPDASSFMFRFSFLPGEYMKSLFVANSDGSNLLRLDGVSSGFHHHGWHNDSSRILYFEHISKSDPNKLYFINKNGKDRRLISDGELYSGHPSISPDGKKIVSDNYGGKFGYSIVLIDAESGKIEKLANFKTDLKRSNAHPVWKKDGSQILYHSDHTGTTQIYIIPMDTN